MRTSHEALPVTYVSGRQLPPATSRAPFIVIPQVTRMFDFRVLRQNRRVVADEARRTEIEKFHEVLTDISLCRATDAVRRFIIAAYVKGAITGSAEHSPLEGNTAVVNVRVELVAVCLVRFVDVTLLHCVACTCQAVFTKRRYRDSWNRTVLRRIAKVHNHSLKAP